MITQVISLIIALGIYYYLRSHRSEKAAEDEWLTTRNFPKKIGTKKTGLHYLVTGGFGFVGSHIVEALLARGDARVRILDCNSTSLFKDDKTVEFVCGDISDLKTVETACEGIDVVIHACFNMAYYTNAIFDTDITNKVNIEGNRNLIQACKKKNVKKMIFVSSNAASFNRMHPGEKLHYSDEKAPYCTNPVSHYGRTKAISEKEALDANNAMTENGEKLKTIAVRVSGIFGPRDWTMAKSFSNGKAVRIGNGMNKHDFSYVENFVHGILMSEIGIDKEIQSLASEQISGRAFYVLNGEDGNLTFKEFTDQMSKHFNVRCKVVPRLLIHFLMHVVSFIYHRTKGKLPTGTLRLLQPSAIHCQEADITYSDKLARKLLNYYPLYSMDEGIECCVAFRDYLKTQTKQQRQNHSQLKEI